MYRLGSLVRWPLACLLVALPATARGDTAWHGSALRDTALRDTAMTMAAAGGHSVPAISLSADPVPPAGRAPTEVADHTRFLGAAGSSAGQLLHLAVRAERRLSFGGQLMATVTLGSPATSVFLSVVHLPGAGQLEQQPLLPGPAAPGASDQAGAPQPAPLLLTAASVALLAQHYRLVRAGRADVGGRQTRVVSALRPDGSAGGRFWLDRRTGLPIRVDLLAADGAPLVSSEFLQLASPLAAPPPLPVEGTDASRRLVSAARPPTDAPAACRHIPPALGAEMDLVDSRLLTRSKGRAVHLTYSDGLFTLSLFCQPGSLDATGLHTWTRRLMGRTTVWSHDGTLRRAAWQSGDAVVTLVTDAPDPGEDVMLTGAVHQLASPPQPHGFLARLQRGIHRLDAWFHPFR